ncbi:MarR family transcriptional regulator [Ornithinibacillus gellani]|uniref:MarR family winged helix-turn-helix transcriptional regulator n=1 Tax=Ornithinibacillus gellani TaxID=2293253 RepID=UPI000F46F443|nr:MarR family transcriptional regulator [Ornithinibacillus gellani]TQS76427.1 MarR family transcriptional regulator [Ornithinibacillus gellani]
MTGLFDKKHDPSLKLFVVLSKTYRVMMEEVEKDIQTRGLRLTDFAVLELLYHRGETPLQKIGKKILLASGSLTYVIDKLENKGLLKRMPSPVDRRITLAALTASGHELLDTIFPGHWSKIEQLTNGLTLDEKKQVTHLLKKLGTNIRTY